MNITQITTCKGRSENVLKNLGYWLKSPIHQLVLVDYGCNDSVAKKVSKTKHWKNPKLTVLKVSDKLTGPFYNHGRARNLGVQAAKNELFLFMDADTFISGQMMETMLERADYDVMTAIDQAATTSELSVLSDNWIDEGQILIKSAVFYDINGFSEEYNGWGAETHDLLLRAKRRGVEAADIRSLPNYNGFRHRPHMDTDRSRYIPAYFSLKRMGKPTAFTNAFQFYEKKRARTCRAQPGRSFGLSKPSQHVRIFMGGYEKSYNPGEVY